MDSAIYQGKVFHQRFVPTQHKFDYDIYLFWLHLDELADLSESLMHFSATSRARVRFNRDDYLGPREKSLALAVKEKMTQLGANDVEGDIFMLGQLRIWGLYFSPVNFYYLRTPCGHFSYLLAEVSNTPWNERHYYLVDLDKQDDTEKAFHVSPFNPMDMTYQWHIGQPSSRLSLTMNCVRDKKEFSAGIRLSRLSLNNTNLSRVMKRIPSMTIKTMVGIYWQAIKLFFKRTPIYDHPKKSQE
ncbi:DUF1365 family protein [Alteromonas sp. 345S023]|uniref:DUF1365 family protein n=1 Tax=Alteromonas profundi TaxID=2696062 RepID=A0A7X5LMJ2_9ALTE|nr:DUF1365 domain-containing protein [Alteromonas profundi]NDV92135.1 DUF1365 family protein [Alteromonas profundi]